jgi:hypothetical protein
MQCDLRPWPLAHLAHLSHLGFLGVTQNKAYTIGIFHTFRTLPTFFGGLIFWGLMEGGCCTHTTHLKA